MPKNDKVLTVVRSAAPSSRDHEEPAGLPIRVEGRKVHYDWGDVWKDQMRGIRVADWTDEECMDFCEFMLTGASMAEVCRAHGVSYISLWRRMNHSQKLREHYLLVQQESMHAYVDLMMRVALEVDDTRRGAIVVDVMKWTAERRNKIYQARSESSAGAGVTIGIEYRVTMPAKRKAGDDSADA